MRIFLLILLFSSSFFLQSCSAVQPESQVKTGAQVLLSEHLQELEGKRVGLVMNPTARVEEIHMLDTLLARGVNITALFSPEHGFRGDRGAGETIENGVDQETGLPVFSLYGSTRKPTAQMLKDVDILIFDMQDVGARFYTYNATMGNVIEAAAAQNIPVWILDRPNPAGGKLISGWMMKQKHQSFVGKYPIPMVHGMTLGELAKMIVGERWIDNAGNADVRVIPMEGWKRTMLWPDTGLNWIPPSPNLPTFEHAFIYLGTVLFEGINISEGRGTEDPFLLIGAPTTELTTDHISELRGAFSGVSVERISFTPKPIPGKAVNPDFKGEECHGVRVTVADPSQYDPVMFGAKLLSVMMDATPNAQLNNYIEKLTGIDKETLLNQLKSGTYEQEWEKSSKNFRELRKKYLIYN